MFSLTPSRRVVFAAGTAVFAAVALAFATSAVGTGTSDGVEIAKLKRQVAALQADAKSTHATVLSQIAVINVSSRLAFIVGAGIHGMETRFPTTGLTARDIEAIQRTLAVTSKLGWPDPMKEEASELRTALRSFFSAWYAGNKGEAFAQLKAFHAAYHVLEAVGYQWLGAPAAPSA